MTGLPLLPRLPLLGTSLCLLCAYPPAAPSSFFLLLCLLPCMVFLEGLGNQPHADPTQPFLFPITALLSRVTGALQEAPSSQRSLCQLLPGGPTIQGEDSPTRAPHLPPGCGFLEGRVRTGFLSTSQYREVGWGALWLREGWMDGQTEQRTRDLFLPFLSLILSPFSPPIFSLS